jgi:hypothetical protein
LYKYENKNHDLDEIEEMIIILKTQLEEAKRIEEVVRIQLKENEDNCEKLEAKIVSLRKELEKTNNELSKSLKFGKCTKILDNIHSYQRSPFMKTCIGYDEKQRPPEGDASTNITNPSEKENEEETQIYSNSLKGSINNKRNNNKGKEMMTLRNLILLIRIRMSSEESSHQEGLSQPSTKIFFLAIVFHAIIFLIKH